MDLLKFVRLRSIGSRWQAKHNGDQLIFDRVAQQLLYWIFRASTDFFSLRCLSRKVLNDCLPGCRSHPLAKELRLDGVARKLIVSQAFGGCGSM
jgi:hypothetical protein